MSPQDLTQRELYKFTGPPENWLTAIKFMTWGLEEKYLDRWQKIEPGDIFLMHSTSTNTIVKGAPSSVIGFGVVSPSFSKKDSPLWLQEIEQQKNIWPLLVPFSEIYLFSELRPGDALVAPDGRNSGTIESEAKELLANASPLPTGFPQMGSFSSVKSDVVIKIFESAQRFYLYSSVGEAVESYVKPNELKKVESVEDISGRKSVTLQEISIVNQKTIKKGNVTYTKDLEALERADNAHQDTLRKLLELLKTHGYETRSNRYVDLFARKNNNLYLFEVKSIGNKNFRSQSRKGIAQLFEYEYFEIRKYIDDNNLKSTANKAIIYSEAPSDMNYIGFINDLKMSAGYFEGSNFRSSGFAAAFKNMI